MRVVCVEKLDALRLGAMARGGGGGVANSQSFVPALGYSLLCACSLELSVFVVM